MLHGLFHGPDGLARLKAHMHLAYLRRPAAPTSTQHYFRGWLHALASVSACDPDTLYDAHRFVSERGFEKPSAPGIELYEYPSLEFRRVEGKSTLQLEEEIAAGGPHKESRIVRLYDLAENPTHSLHFLAKHLIFLTSVTLAAQHDSRRRTKEN